MRNINGKAYPDNLRGANLRGADLTEADLRGADLTEADLRGADLTEANLRIADLRGANLRGADLYGADLRGANLTEANLTEANLRIADLIEADLRGANLRGANLRGADLYGANLRRANLYGADLRGAKNLSEIILTQTTICSEGDIIGYKKLANGIICKIRIPAEAKRSNATSRKCRAEYAVVLEGEGSSRHDEGFKYVKGETVCPTKPFDECRWNECAPGIHFFLTRAEAEVY